MHCFTREAYHRFLMMGFPGVRIQSFRQSKLLS
jgi:hypothetical protein